jgi:hypothetical protein
MLRWQNGAKMMIMQPVNFDRVKRIFLYPNANREFQKWKLLSMFYYFINEDHGQK